jgi:hypothetical protein
MAKSPTPEESARRILQLFASHHRRAGEILMLGAVNFQFQEGGEYRGADLQSGLKHAVAQGWIDPDYRTAVKITDAGATEVGIATLPTPEESARRILQLFAAHNRRAGEILMLGAVNMQFQEGGHYRAADLQSGLTYAAEHGWIDPDYHTAVRITEAGFSEM